MKKMDEIVEAAIEEATKPRIFTLKRVLFGAAVLVVGTGVIALIAKTAKDAHDNQEIDIDVDKFAEDARAAAKKDLTAQIKKSA